MIKKRTIEFDAFGPWVYLITGSHKLPPLFADYADVLSGAEMCFKIPRKIDRCDANPDMNLYDLVVGIFKKEIIVLERKTRDGGEYAELDRIESDRITSLCKYDCLLRGSLTIHTVERSIVISYNTVSECIINDAVNLIRRIQPQKITVPGFEVLPYNFDTMEFRFVNIVNKIIQEDDSLHLIAYQPNLFSRIPREFNWEFFNRFGFTEQALSSFVLMSNSKELVIAHRYFFLKRKSTDSYARYFYYIPYDSINEIDAITQSNGISGVMLKTKRLDLFLKADIGNKSLNSLIEKLRAVLN
jgi:hypothetical protein